MNNWNFSEAFGQKTQIKFDNILGIGGAGHVVYEEKLQKALKIVTDENEAKYETELSLNISGKVTVGEIKEKLSKVGKEFDLLQVSFIFQCDLYC